MQRISFCWSSTPWRRPMSSPSEMMVPRPRGPSAAVISVLGTIGVLSMAGCRNEMYDQAKVKPLSESTFFANGQNARPLPQDTVARGFLREDKPMFAGLAPSGGFVTELPVPLTRELLER